MSTLDPRTPIIVGAAQINDREYGSEPIDLMEVGGSSIVKRVAPALIAIVVLLFLLRRRRH